jgi:phosphoribosylaminoimidazole carboxylase PurE protein
MGSDSDLEVMTGAMTALEQFDIPYEVVVTSAHRSPERTRDYVITAEKRGLRVIICGAGWAAHLAGVVAAETTLPVIGVPIASSPLAGADALHSTVQMPPGVPVACMAIGKGGATNAGILTAQILATADRSLRKRLQRFKKEQAAEVERKAAAVAARLRPRPQGSNRR